MARCGIRAGELWCWGLNRDGQLGDGTTTDQPTPTRIGGADDWERVWLQGQISCGKRASSSDITCWGKDSIGAFGRGYKVNYAEQSVVLDGLLSKGTTLGAYHACGLEAAHRLRRARRA